MAYPLQKLDLVAIPDFAAGAMENWGLITFRETALLVSDLSGVSGVYRVAGVVAHEMAHLVSPFARGKCQRCRQQATSTTDRSTLQPSDDPKPITVLTAKRLAG